MRVLVNLATLKTGGGQNVAMNFLHAICAEPTPDVTWVFAVARQSEPHIFLKTTAAFRFIVAPRSAAARGLFECCVAWFYLKRHRIDIIYSYFGYGLFPHAWPQVSGSADSNLYFPEIDFWKGYRGLNRLKRWVVDMYRRRGLTHATAVVFENASLEKRGRELFGLRHTVVIKPSIQVSQDTALFRMTVKHDPGPPRGLFLCGWHLNKNVMLVPALAAELKIRNHPVIFVVTAPLDGSPLHQRFNTLLKKYGVEDLVLMPGPVPKAQLESLFRQIHYVLLLSKLESFSNNIIEAWRFERPLVVADEPWSRALCGDSAMYVDRDSITDIADKLVKLSLDSQLADTLIQRGKACLAQYPTIEERVRQEVAYLQHVLTIS